MSVWLILLPAFVACVVILLAHVYFGLHVLGRGIVFVDLSLAQIAALGASLAFLAGEDPHGGAALAASFALTILAAAGFAALRAVPSTTTREVVIGIVYVVAAAVSILVLSRSTVGMDALKELFNGSVLLVSWQEIGWLAFAYAAIGMVHAAGRRRFLALSFATGGARPALRWEVLFFVSFAIVITLAVPLAGILLVFAYLIIPAFAATLLAESFAHRLLVGWLLALAATLAGLALVLVLDLPVGPSLVATLAALPPVALLIRGRRRP
ncbi:MAG: metal ABC transporter permease [Alphaproteobacteria bacterium]|nr:metal ABC transporter permease [Alphaproteobacteria bacterium]